MRNDLKTLSMVLESDPLMDQESASDFNEVTCGDLIDGSIYSLLTEKEIESIEAFNARELNEGSAEVEDLDTLKRQAEEYFKKPSYYPLKEESIEHVTGFVSVFYGFGQNGEMLFKSTGAKIEMELEKVESVEAITEALNLIGYELNELVQVKFYSPSLHRIVGMIDYKEGEKKQFEVHSNEYPNILYAMPSVQEVDTLVGDDSIYSALDRILNEESIYGYSAEEVLGKEGFSHWSVTKEFFETRSIEIREEESIVKVEKARTMSRAKFQKGFELEIDWIRRLNVGEATVSELKDSGSSHLVNRILYVSNSNSFQVRLQKKGVCEQLSALSRFFESNDKLNCPSIESEDRRKAIELVKRINSGADIKVHELDPSLICSTMSLLWDRSAGIRIDYKFVQTYFQLKERFQALRTSQMAA